jgi:Tfp pilus assembly protein PilF
MALALQPEYAPAWINVGKLRIAQKQLEAAIEIFKHAAALEPGDARTFRLLGEAYLQNKQGTLGAQALNHAIRLDPQGQAECHLQLAHLYQLAGAMDLAAEEYKKFLAKVPNHPEKGKFEKFIKQN